VKSKLTILTSAYTGFFSKPMLYFSLAFLVCISFYPTFDRCISSTQDLCWQTDKSMLAMVIDTLLNAESSERDTNDDDQQTAVDFLSVRMNWSLLNAYSIESRKVPSKNSLPDSAPLEKFTPPPKG